MESTRRPGFSLIELLVVIAIIGLLIGVLLPALGSARRTARGAANLANLRSLGQAMELYVNEHGLFPPMRLPNGQTHQATGRPRARWHWALGDYVGQPYVPQSPEEHQRFLTSDDFDRVDNRVFMDPGHRLEDFRSNTTGNIQVLRNGSYGFNYHYLGNTRTEGPGGAAANFPVRASRVQVPFRTVVVGDSKGSQTLSQQGFREHSYTMDPPRLDPVTRAQTWAHAAGPSPADSRHAGKAMVAFLDGHAAAHSLAELGYVVEDERAGLVRVNAGSNAWFNGLGSDSGATP